jgi:polyhydroxybutyrate depolymerase
MFWLCSGCTQSSQPVTPSDSDTTQQDDTSDTDTDTEPISQNAVVQITVDSVTREYRLYIPTAKPDNAMPLLLAFHGGGGRNYPFPQQSQFHQLAETEGFVVAYPLSELLPGNEGEWLLNTDSQRHQDIDFVEGVIEDISRYASIDSTQIYATGYSLGSMFTYELACHLNDRFAAIASFAGTMPLEPASCVLNDTVPIMHLHSGNDPIIPYSEPWDWKNWPQVGRMWDIPGLVGDWIERYNCQTTNQTETSSSLHIVADSCDGGVRVEHHRLVSGGHNWPNNIDGTPTPELLWNFFSDFSKN